jgi:hypothetical protein
MPLTVDPNPCSETNVTEARRRLRSLREQADRLDVLLAEAEALEAGGPSPLSAMFSAHLLLKLAKLDRRLTALADEVSAVAAEELFLASGGPAAPQVESGKGAGE